MIREEFDGYSEPPRPSLNKAKPWLPLVVAIFAGLAVAHLAGLTKPLVTIALPSGGGSHAPGWRLVGDWESEGDPMFRRVCHLAPRKGYSGTGVYMADSGLGMRAVIFKITSEDPSGRHLETEEYVPEMGADFRVRYTIADDGRSMRRECTARTGCLIFGQYRYVGRPTAKLPREFLPK